MGKAFSRAGIPWDDCGHEDRGDGMLILVPAELPKGLLAGSLPSEVVSALHAHNSAHPGPEQIRLRMTLHAGEVTYDEHGVTAASINLAFRLLDSAALREALSGSSGVLAVIASSWFFEEVIRHSPAAARAAYRPVPVAVRRPRRPAGSACRISRIHPGRRGWSTRRPAQGQPAARRRWRCARCHATRRCSRGVPANWTGW